MGVAADGVGIPEAPDAIAAGRGACGGAGDGGTVPRSGPGVAAEAAAGRETMPAGGTIFGGACCVASFGAAVLAGAAGAVVTVLLNKSCLTLLISTCDSNGLVTKSLAPAWIPLSLSKASKVPASRMTGTARSMGSPRRAAQAS